MSDYEAIKTEIVKTRKHHWCHCCLETFPKGVKMQKQTLVGDGSISDIYVCESCQNILSEHLIEIENNEGEIEEGAVREWKLETQESEK